jgi:hypothetical protein
MRYLRKLYPECKVGDYVKFKIIDNSWILGGPEGFFKIISIAKSSQYISYKKDSTKWFKSNPNEPIPDYYMYEIFDKYGNSWWKNANYFIKAEDYEVSANKYNL